MAGGPARNFRLSVLLGMLSGYFFEQTMEYLILSVFADHVEHLKRQWYRRHVRFTPPHIFVACEKLSHRLVDTSMCVGMQRVECQSIWAGCHHEADAR